MVYQPVLGSLPNSISPTQLEMCVLPLNFHSTKSESHFYLCTLDIGYLYVYLLSLPSP